ncbi:MAG: HAMP domain-containing protein, partial [Planctomycetes bacterium]|nr:HAMP domain-containing protein [Planctomycetota bacterium]
ADAQPHLGRVRVGIGFESARAAMRQRVTGALVLAMSIALLATIAAGLAAARLVRPLIALQDATARVARGQLDERVAVSGTSELRTLAQTFNEMAANLQTTLAERFRAEAELERARNHALEASSAKSRFLANMSHEIRTPMNGVIAMVGLLRETKLDDEQREFVETVHVSATHLLSLINDILD